MFSRALTIAASKCRPAFNGYKMVAAARPTMSMQIYRAFSTQKLNDNEIIEYVEGKVFEVLKSAAKCKHEKLARTASFDDLGFDSLDGVELVLAMEEYFGFDISNQEAEKITSVMDAIQVFHSHVVKR